MAVTIHAIIHSIGAGRCNTVVLSETPPVPRRKATIRDVAKAAGVSSSTVSRAFARPGRVNAETARKIFAAANVLGYHRDAIVSASYKTYSGRVGHAGLIAVIVPDIANQFFLNIIRAAQRECAKQDFDLIMLESRENAIEERAIFDKTVADVDGVILAASRMPDNMIRKCAQICPIVSVNRVVLGIPSVVIGITVAIKEMMEILIAGEPHRRITYIDGPAASWSVGFRWNTLKAECLSRAIAVKRIWPCPPTFDGGYACAERYMQDPTGVVIAHNDLMALGFIAAMKTRGYVCPRDYAVVGFDDDMVGQVSNPTLTSVQQPLFAVGTQAARFLLHRVSGEPVSSDVITFPSALVIRNSSDVSVISQ